MKAMLVTGELGDITLVRAEFGQNHPDTPRTRDLALGASTLLDKGIYPLQLANLFFNGPPKKIIAAGHLFPEGTHTTWDWVQKIAMALLAQTSKSVIMCMIYL